MSESSSETDCSEERQLLRRWREASLSGEMWDADTLVNDTNRLLGEEDEEDPNERAG